MEKLKRLIRYLDRQEFCNRVARLLKEDKEYKYVLVSLRVDNYNQVDKLLGGKCGDLILMEYGGNFNAGLSDREWFTRSDINSFVLFLRQKDDQKMTERLNSLVKLDIKKLFDSQDTYAVSGGIVPITNANEDVEALIKKANSARNQVAQEDVERFSYYVEETDTLIKDVSQLYNYDLADVEALGDSLDIGVVKAYLDELTVTSYINKKALSCFGCAKQEFVDKYHNSFLSFIHPDDIRIVKENSKQLLMNCKPLRFKVRLIKQDGSLIYIEGQSYCLKGKDGRRIGLHIFQDVTRDIVYTKDLQTALQDKMTELELLYATIPGGVAFFEADEAMTLKYNNSGFIDLVGYTNDEIADKFSNKLANLICKEDLSAVWQSMNEQLQARDTRQIEFRLVTKSSRQLTWVLAQSRVLEDVKGKLSFCVVIIDITREKENREALRLNEEKYKIIVEQSNDIMFEWDFDTDSVVFSDKYEKVLGYSPVTDNVSVNPNVMLNIHPDDLDIFKLWLKNVNKKGSNESCDFRFKTIDNNYLWMRTKTTTICDKKGVPIKAIGVFSNIDAEKAMIDNLRIKSEQDPLTKLYNKEETKRRVQTYLALNGQVKSCALLLIDIDNFKEINDHLGHQFGDSALVEIANKIKDTFRTTDIVGRIGGDEFIVLIKGISSKSFARERAGAMVNALRNLYSGDNQEYNITASIGVAFCPEHAATFDELYKLADVALYEAKKKGKDRYVAYDNDNINEAFVAYKTPMETIGGFLSTYFEGDLIYNIFQMLYETKDVKTTINKVLQLTGKRFGVDRAYIFEFDNDNKIANNTYEWCAKGMPKDITSYQNVDMNSFSGFLSNYNSDGIFYCNDITTLDDVNIIKDTSIKAMLHCGIFDEGRLCGFIGFDDCKHKRMWRGDEVATLSYISKILSIFIAKKQLTNELWESYQNHIQMLDNINGYVYVIDTNTFETLYVNSSSYKAGIRLGDKCYKSAFGTDHPCTNCPVHKLTSKNAVAKQEMYSQRLQKWVESAATRLKWSSGNEAALICCVDISRFKQTNEVEPLDDTNKK